MIINKNKLINFKEKSMNELLEYIYYLIIIYQITELELRISFITLIK
jgi:hypothetical protein